MVDFVTVESVRAYAEDDPRVQQATAEQIQAAINAVGSNEIDKIYVAWDNAHWLATLNLTRQLDDPNGGTPSETYFG